MVPSFSQRLAASWSGKDHTRPEESEKDEHSADHKLREPLIWSKALANDSDSDSKRNGILILAKEDEIPSIATGDDRLSVPSNVALGLVNSKRTRESKHRKVLAPKSAGIFKTKSELVKLNPTDNGVKVPLKAPHEPGNPNPKRRVKKIKKSTSETRKATLKNVKEARVDGLNVEHPISLHFKSVTEAYARHILETIPSFLANGFANLVGNLSAITTASAIELDELSSLHDALFFPIEEVELEIKLNKGKPEETTTYEIFGARLENFMKVFDNSETKLKTLHEQWNQITKEIGDLRIESDKTQPQSLNGSYLHKARIIDSNYQTRTEAAQKSLENDLQELLEKAVRSEKAFDDRRRQSNKQLLLLLQQEEGEGDVDVE